jgi:hypothetical protein
MSPFLQKGPSFEGSGFEHKTAKLLSAGNLRQANKRITGLEPLKIMIQ